MYVKTTACLACGYNKQSQQHSINNFHMHTAFVTNLCAHYDIHRTKIEISYIFYTFQNMTFPGISYMFLVEDRATFYANERNV